MEENPLLALKKGRKGPLIKLCGIMDGRGLAACGGADIAGFVVEYPESVPWNLTADAALALMHRDGSPATCAVVGGPRGHILSLAQRLRPDFVQLHHREGLQDIAAIARGLAPLGIGTIKALRIGADGRCDFACPDPIEAARLLSDTGICGLVVDAYTPNLAGGTGLRVNLSLYEAICRATPLPVLLAGGITPENAAAIQHAAHPFGMDILTGIE
nr:phosphoribosylanthranilate isomerase [bacterium]